MDAFTNAEVAGWQRPPYGRSPGEQDPHFREDYGYDPLGFRCGVEIHQQLLTDTKLFCRCPAGVYTRDHDGELLRHMRPTLSEMGTYDGTALMEFKTRKTIIYLLHRDNVCTYEMDDTPPFPLNQQALDIAIAISLQLNCKIVDELHIARKQYLDGSIPTGFQRTAIVGLGGWLPFRGRKIGIRQLSLEEDSCREVSDQGHRVVWRTDRLGMPLVEVVTEPDMRDPEESAAVVRRIGRLMRATRMVRRGIGVSRQDVNVSVTGGTRIEVKGVPRFPLIPRLTHYEALRQKALLDIRDELRARGLSADALEVEKADVAHLFADIRPPEIPSDAPAFGAIRIRGCGGILKVRTAPFRTFAHEVAGRLRVIACLDQAPNLVHTDDWPGYPLSAEQRAALLDHMGAREGDVVVLVWGDEQDVKTGLEEVRLRFVDAFEGVPAETRQMLDDGATDFERILPGPERMYPDTDSPPHRLDPGRIERIRRSLPDPPWERERRWRELGLPAADARSLAISPFARVFERLEREGYAELKTAGVVLTEGLTALRRAGVPVETLADDLLLDVFAAYARGGFHRENFPRVLIHLAGGESLPDVLARPEITPVGEEEARRLADQVLEGAALRFGPDTPRETRVRALMGPVMHVLRGRHPGQAIRDLVEAAAG